jgi:predicted alpha/beta superfamily hydrolase
LAAEAEGWLEPGRFDAGRVRTHAGFRSRYLAGERAVRVYLPPGYEEEKGRRYPLLILQDGQNLFDPEAAFVRGRTWRLAETAEAAMAAGEAEPLVIAGVDHGGERRLAEYTPTRDAERGGGEAAAYGTMLIDEVLPFLRTMYRLETEAERTGLGGSSLGGLVSLWLGLRYPETFGRVAALSPSVWWDERFILGYVEARARELRQRPRVWLDAGDAESQQTMADAELLERQLRLNGWRQGQDLHFERVRGGTHDEEAWAERVRPMLRFLFPGQQK